MSAANGAAVRDVPADEMDAPKQKGGGASVAARLATAEGRIEDLVRQNAIMQRMLKGIFTDIAVEKFGQAKIEELRQQIGNSFDEQLAGPAPE